MEIRVCFVPQPDEEPVERPAVPVTSAPRSTNIMTTSAVFPRRSARSRVIISPHRSRGGSENRPSWGGRRVGSVSCVPPKVGSDSRITTSDYQRGVLHISVADSGAGISEADQAKLFKGVVQFNPDKLQGGGGRYTPHTASFISFSPVQPPDCGFPLYVITHAHSFTVYPSAAALPAASVCSSARTSWTSTEGTSPSPPRGRDRGRSFASSCPCDAPARPLW